MGAVEELSATKACWCNLCGQAAAHISSRDAADFPAQGFPDKLCGVKDCINPRDGVTRSSAGPRCVFHHRLAELDGRRPLAGCPRWFSYFGGSFQRILDERVAAHLEAAVDWSALPEEEEDTRVPSHMELETTPRPGLRLHGRSVAAAEALAPLLPHSVPCSAVRAWVACRCKKRAACSCGPLTAGASVVLRLSASRPGAPPCSAGAACTVPSLQHRYECQH
jgi:hypothetical protein